METPLEVDTLERLWAKTVIRDGHWLYMGLRSVNGYGRIRVQDKFQFVHRLALALKDDADVDGLGYVDHHCQYRHCWNPEHLMERKL